MKTDDTTTLAKGNSVASHSSGMYLFFSLADEEYGIDIFKVKRVLGIKPFKKISRKPVFMKEIVNCRGDLIPIVDLHNKLGLKTRGCADLICVIVLEIDSYEGKASVGIIADSLLEALNIKASEIKSPLNISTRPPYILGEVRSTEGVKTLLDIDLILGEDLIDHLNHAA